MKNSIKKAGIETGVHRSTIHRWLKSGRLRKDAEGNVDRVSILRLKNEQKTGRPGGFAYGHRGRCDLEDTEANVTGALTLIEYVLKSLLPEERLLVWKALLPELANEKALAEMLGKIHSSIALQTAQVVPKEPEKKPEPLRVQSFFEGFTEPDKLSNSDSPNVKGKTKKK
jgi:hypothetical protein